MIIRKSLKYYQEKARIDKATNQRTAYKIQVYNNNKIDEFVKSYNSDNPTVKPSESILWAELSVLNKPEVYRNYNRIINSKYTSNEAFEKMLVKNKANKELNRIVEAEVERIAKNLDYVEQVMQKYEVPMKMYNDYKAQQASKSLANRQKILNDVAVKANDLLVSEGINIPSNVFSYRNLDATAENLLRQSQMQAKHEEINAINDNYVNEGKDKIYKTKQWIWTGEGKTTRHGSNHLQIRQLNEPFIIVNDETLEIDELMHPSDPAGSPGNTFICYCDIEYLTEDEETWDILDSHIVNTPTMADTGLKSVAFANASEIVEAFKPKGEFIDPVKMDIFKGKHTGNYMVDSMDGLEVIDGKPVFKGLEIKNYDPEKGLGKFTEAELEAHNEQFKNNPFAEVEKAQEVIEEANEAPEPKGEPIQVDKLIKSTNTGEYIFDPDYLTGDIIYDPVSGKHTYKGLVIEGYSEQWETGSVPLELINEHNKQFGVEPYVEPEPEPTPEPEPIPEPANEPPLSVKEPIDTTNLYESIFNKYYIHDVDGLIEHNGKYEINGLDVTQYVKSDGIAKVPKAVVEEYNKQFTIEAEPAPAKPVNPNAKEIKIDELVTTNDGTVVVDKYDGMEYDPATGKATFNGLDVTPYYNESVEWAEVPPEVIEEHNKQFGIETEMPIEPNISDDFIKMDDNYYLEKTKLDFNDMTGDYEYNGVPVDGELSSYGYFKPETIKSNLDAFAEKASEYTINNQYINGMKTIKTIKQGGEIYMVDETTGKKYVYDEKSTYEKAQDNEQFKVDFTDIEKESTEHWGAHGHQIINGLIYEVKRVDHDTGRIKQDYSFYAKEMRQLRPLYDKVQELARECYQEGTLDETTFNTEVNRIKGKAEKIINGTVEDYRKTRLDVDDVREAMWEIFDMDIVAEKSPNLLQDTFFVRFGHVHPEWLEIGKRVKFDGFTSTTYESNSASHFEKKMDENPNRWAILVMAETESNGVRLNSQFNALLTEREWMLIRNQEFDVVEYDEGARTILIKLV